MDRWNQWKQDMKRQVKQFKQEKILVIPKQLSKKRLWKYTTGTWIMEKVQKEIIVDGNKVQRKVRITRLDK